MLRQRESFGAATPPEDLAGSAGAGAGAARCLDVAYYPPSPLKVIDGAGAAGDLRGVGVEGKMTAKRGLHVIAGRGLPMHR